MSTEHPIHQPHIRFKDKTIVSHDQAVADTLNSLSRGMIANTTGIEAHTKAISALCWCVVALMVTQIATVVVLIVR